MSLRIATWNVNSLRVRLEQLARFLTEARPDVICLQEIKVANEQFPFAFFHELGYPQVLAHGQKAYHGVAIASRRPFAEEGTRHWCRKTDSRHAFVRLDCGLEVHNFYVPSGGDLPDREANDKFDHKVRFLGAMARWCRQEKIAAKPLVLLGDLNVAPLDCDVWNHKRLRRSVGHSPLECDLMAKLLRAGRFTDAARHFVPPPAPLYTWWGYRFPQAFAKDYGWRLDHAWVTPAALPRLRAVEIFKQARSWERTSDHVPVILDLD